MDTGSSVSILPGVIYNRYFQNCSLTEPKVKLVTYLKEAIPVLGCLRADVLLNDAATSACFYIVKGGSALMGMDLIRALNISFHFSAAPKSDDYILLSL